MPHKKGTLKDTNSKYFYPVAEMGYTHQAMELGYFNILTNYLQKRGILEEQHKQGTQDRIK